MCNLISKSTIHRILREELGVWKVCARWVPRMLFEEHKALHIAAAIEFLSQYADEGESMLDRIITGDETMGVLLYSTDESSVQSLALSG